MTHKLNECGCIKMQKLSIRQVLALLIVAPILSIAFNVWQLAPIATGKMRDAKALERSVKLGEFAGDLVHSLQLERGSSAGLLVATEERSVHRNRMLAAQEKVDKALVDFTTAFDAAREEGLLSGRSAKFSEALQKLADDIKSTREKIITSNIEVPELLAFYSGIINDLILGTTTQGSAGTEETIADLRLGLRSLMFAKERAGLQRATGNALILSEQIDPVLLENFTVHTGIQQQFLEQTRYALGENGKAMIDQRLQADAAAAHTEAERGLIDAAREGKPIPVKANEW